MRRGPGEERLLVQRPRHEAIHDKSNNVDTQNDGEDLIVYSHTTAQTVRPTYEVASTIAKRETMMVNAM